MSDRYAIAVAQTRDLTKAVRSYALSQGQPSPTQDTYRRRVLAVLQGHWRAGQPTTLTSFEQSAFIVEADGIVGPAVATDAWTWDGATALTAPASTFVAADATAAWVVWVTTTENGWTRGIYPVVSAAGNVLTLGSGSASALPPVGFFLPGVFAEKYVPLGAPMNSDQNTPPRNVTNISQSPWYDYGVWVPPATLVNGGRLEMKLRGRIRMRRLKGRPHEAVVGGGVYDAEDGGDVYITLDPWSSALAHPYNASGVSLGINEVRANEVQFFPARASRLGWEPEVNYVPATFERGVAITYPSSTTTTGTDQISNVGTPFTASFPKVGAIFTVTAAGSSGLALATDYFVKSRPSATAFTASLTSGGATVALSNSAGDVDIEFYDLRAVYTAHGLYNGECVHVNTYDLSNANNTVSGSALGPPSTLVEGQAYYVAGRTAGKFYLALDAQDSVRATYINDASTDLIISQPVRTGSRHSLTWKFHFDTTEIAGATSTAADDRITHAGLTEVFPPTGAEVRVTAAGSSTLDTASLYYVFDRPTATSMRLALIPGGDPGQVTLVDSTGDVDLDFDEVENYSLFEAHIVGFADGRTAEDEQGVQWTCTMTIWPNRERVGVVDRRLPILKDGVLTMGSGVSRTTPGASMSAEFNETDATSAPLFFVKRYFTAPDAVTFTGATATDAGEYLTHDDFVGLKVGDAITIADAGLSGIGLATYYVHSKPNASNSDTIRMSTTLGGGVYSFTPGSTADVGGTFLPTYGAFTSAFWDWGGNYDVVYIAEQLLTETVSVSGYDEYPITPTFQGNEVTGFSASARNSQGYRAATITEVWVGGVLMGEVSYHDNVRRILFIRYYDPAVRVRYGDAMVLLTYRNERIGSTWDWGASVQSTDATALVVRPGPQGTRLSARICVGGPPTTDCELNVRGGVVETLTVESR